uniref:Uncharacterized protein n=1 Tax=Rhizophora mucronata TaxID=61149 RepID=A0A2P2QUF1_RHIMU
MFTAAIAGKFINEVQSSTVVFKAVRATSLVLQ